MGLKEREREREREASWKRSEECSQNYPTAGEKRDSIPTTQVLFAVRPESNSSKPELCQAVILDYISSDSPSCAHDIVL